jgi:SOS-response transcriptional repressor LexA
MSKTRKKGTEDMYLFIETYVQHNGMPPTNREIGIVLSISTNSQVCFYLRKLVRQGKIILAPGKARPIQLKSPGVQE